MAIRIAFEKLTRTQCKASIMLEGLTGSGKSGAAIMIAYALVGGFNPAISDEDKQALWDKIYAIDTENGSLRLFDGIPASWGGTYSAINGQQLGAVDGYNPSNYLAIRKAAVDQGASVVIEDSITHMWTAKGGVLDIVNEVKRKNPKIDNYRVWGTTEVSSEKQRLDDTVRSADCHVITTVRVKEKFDMQYDATEQKNKVVSLGEQQIQQDGLKYEPDLVLSMITPGSGNPPTHPRVMVIKSRYAIFTRGEEYELTPDLLEQLRKYLAEGTDPKTLLEKQRLDYVAALSEYLTSNPGKRPIWQELKKQAGMESTKLEEIPLTALKKLYTQIVAD